MSLTIEHEGKNYENWTAADLADAGVPAGVIGAALKAQATKTVAAFADRYRARLASASAGKLAEYRIKEEIARDPATAKQAELDLLSREAAARGMDQSGLLTLIGSQANAYREIALLIGVLEAETGAAIDAVPADAEDVETQLNAVLLNAHNEAEVAYSASVLQIANN